MGREGFDDGRRTTDDDDDGASPKLIEPD